VKRHLGYPFVMALAVHQSADGREVRRTGVLPVPTRRDRFPGGHFWTMRRVS
jgi:hypothetical protein